MYISNKKEHFNYKGGCGVCGHHAHTSRHLKEELAWAIDKQHRTISNIISYTTKE